jgi:hypothetical protein
MAKGGKWLINSWGAVVFAGSNSAGGKHAIVV